MLLSLVYSADIRGSRGIVKIAGNPPPVCGCIRSADRYTELSSSELCH